ncbi:hypothetical protein CLAFUW4_00284 [Fulvia fulva]|uniref:Uncharacterized protein n=1 Tax=Passalora fulva TaxID=5499 RepID=A0A9Q8P2P2_PASFU|nr:uncharacterized protein CLAFUR5_00285 [Fulvia fulva]KAK4634719.1 hypothetical protein CLAFUR4_00284 [Fulvia fulva]KAK4637281.1 hypothetical protein CLAFUR0_00285 [Fulvia fulva]UJO10906.1 hypothetical protein CLAFUR5_00285 [Fulvia fulva]WPV10322.1 hypothetical protein CLAFUW4_00284 [Fulvia fulva]WPV24484.1 hypothetical protein CLAFUW7_00288 [Fulvia fulva]
MSSKHRKRESGRAPRIPPLDPEEVQILSRVEYDKGRLDAFLRTLQKYPMDGPAWSNAVQCTYQLLRRMHVAGEENIAKIGGVLAANQKIIADPEFHSLLRTIETRRQCPGFADAVEKATTNPGGKAALAELSKYLTAVRHAMDKNAAFFECYLICLAPDLSPIDRPPPRTGIRGLMGELTRKEVAKGRKRPGKRDFNDEVRYLGNAPGELHIAPDEVRHPDSPPPFPKSVDESYEGTEGSEHCKSKGRDVYESTLEKFEDLDMNVPRIEGLRQMISRITVRLMHRSRAMEN